MKDLEQELTALIVDALALRDVAPDDIDPNAPLFNEGLGLDSVDALELAMAIHKKYGVQIQADDPTIREAFRSIRNLAGYISNAQAASSR